MHTCRPSLQQLPCILDRDQAAQWLHDSAAAHIGIEGLVLKRVDEPYVARDDAHQDLGDIPVPHSEQRCTLPASGGRLG